MVDDVIEADEPGASEGTEALDLCLRASRLTLESLPCQCRKDDDDGVLLLSTCDRCRALSELGEGK